MALPCGSVTRSPAHRSISHAAMQHKDPRWSDLSTLELLMKSGNAVYG
jgi:hypothetical protein